MRKLLPLLCFFVYNNSSAQSVAAKLDKAWKLFAADFQLKHAIAAFSVADARTGKILFEKNSQWGLAPASTQKIVTSVAFFDLIGKDYRYKTELGYSGSVRKDSLEGFLFVRGTGDPSFGSWRFMQTRPESVFPAFIRSIKAAGIKKMANEFYVDESLFDPLVVPGGWIVDDIGNYYGAGSWGLNWKENQYDLLLKSGTRIDDPVDVTALNNEKDFYRQYKNHLRTAASNSGDNAYIYLPFEGSTFLLKGTIPAGEKDFSISGAVPDAPHDFIDSFRQVLEKESILNKPDVMQFSVVQSMNGPETNLHTYWSPPFDSLNYFFLRRSINLYGEAFIKTIALAKQGFASTEKGIETVRKYYESKGFDKTAINIMDGSGLSPQNRVTTDVMVKILAYAKSRPWFSSFFYALPEYNGMKMKSGSIGGVRSFAGYHKSGEGKEYIFSIIVNNFEGSSGEMVKKIYKLLDHLK